ncbi:hypothetical protein ACFE04_004292 [Oxalis oulophora]
MANGSATIFLLLLAILTATTQPPINLSPLHRPQPVTILTEPTQSDAVAQPPQPPLPSYRHDTIPFVVVVPFAAAAFSFPPPPHSRRRSHSERRGAWLLEELKTSGIFCRESRGWTSAIVVKRRKGESRGGTSGSSESVAKEKKKQAEKSVEREAVTTDNEVNLADNDSSWAFADARESVESSD